MMSEKSKSHKGKNPEVNQKLSSLKEKQDKWMQERAVTKANPRTPIHSSLKEYGTSTKASRSKEKPKTKEEVKKPDAMLWTAGTANQYNGFVVRNGSGKSSSRQNSSRTPIVKKTYTHSSLRDQSSQPISASSSHFVKRSNHRQDGIKDHFSDKDNYVADDDNDDDDSLSESFSKHLSNLDLDENYDFKKYKEVEQEISIVNGSNSKTAKKQNILDKESRHSMENHYCCTCKNLMFNEKHIPQMVFPCGHTFCSSCLSGKTKCPSCCCEIISTQENDSLYAIIRKFKRQLKKEELERKEKQVRNYLDEYKNLSTRIDLMKGEATTVIDEMESITHKLIERRDTLKFIEDNSKEIKKQQQILQQQLESLQTEKERETRNMNALEGDYDKQKKQLQMLEKTIKSIDQNRKQVKELVEELSPSSVQLLDVED